MRMPYKYYLRSSNNTAPGAVVNYSCVAGPLPRALAPYICPDFNHKLCNLVLG
jgi:hypothetical protein